MYIVYVDDNGEENYKGLYQHITVDGRTDDGIIFLCDGERIEVPFNFEIITEEYYKGV